MRVSSSKFSNDIIPKYWSMKASTITTFLSTWPMVGAIVCGFQHHQHPQTQPYYPNFHLSSSVSFLSSNRGRISSSTTRNYATISHSEEKEESTTGEDITNTVNNNNFATSYHAPVMWKECIDGLLDCQRSKERQQHEQQQGNKVNNNNKSSLIFIDGTLGGGGHSAALLENLQPGDIVLGCDVDPMALETASKRLEDYIIDPSSSKDHCHDHPYFIPVQTNFGTLRTALSQIKHPITKQPILSPPSSDNDDENDIDDVDGYGVVDGILLDLGVSSFQIDTPSRGFAFMKDGPLDMRMSSNAINDNGSTGGGLTAADICNEFDLLELQKIFSQYGDEPKSKTIAQTIINHRPITTTRQLTDAIASVTPKFVKRNKRMGQTATFARIFQSLRIVVNNEDGVLRQVFEDACPNLLRKGGRLVVLSYHSMEDRATKRIMRDGSIDATSKSRRRQQDQRDMYGNYIGPKKTFKPIGKRQKATNEEINENSRARSASLRIAERQ